jgi:hypothetical protein
MNTATIEHSAADEGQVVSEQAWSVGRGQRVQLVRPGLRRRTTAAAVVSGTLVIGAADLTDAEFELVIALPGATDRPIAVSSRTIRSLRLGSEGVFHQRGRPPSMWLTMRAELDLPEFDQLTGRGTIVALADLNLNPVEPAFV